MDKAIYIILGLIFAVTAVLTVMIILLYGKIKKSENQSSVDSKIDSMQRIFGDEFSRIRTENANSGKAVREEMRQSLDAMSQKIDAQSKHTVEMLINIRDKNTENADRQNKALENSIAKMQESNEKKLEEMRATVDEKLTSLRALRKMFLLLTEF